MQTSKNRIDSQKANYNHEMLITNTVFVMKVLLNCKTTTKLLKSLSVVNKND